MYAQTPVNKFSVDILKTTAKRFKSLSSFGAIHYAVKANSRKEIIQILSSENFGFEVASLGELKHVQSICSQEARVICSNPVKSIEFLEYARDHNLTYIAADSKDELRKIKKYHPDALVYIRLLVDNSKSDYPLSGKFGVSTDDAYKLFLAGNNLGLNMIGINFHVGSQCKDVSSWRDAIQKSEDLTKELQKDNIRLKYLNIGGGIPGHYLEETPKIEDLFAGIKECLGQSIFNTPDIEVHLEPGRALVADSANVITTVVGKGERRGRESITLDIGVFNGLMEAAQGFHYKMSVFGKKSSPALKEYTVYGPSCDSMDIIAEQAELPEVEIGDRVIIHSTGAYSLEYASNFNGFPPAKVVFC